MAILNKEDYFNRIKSIIGEDTGDDAMSFIEDMTDTFNDFESKTSSTTDWEKKYNDLDASWREKYKARFFSSEETPQNVKDEQKEDVIHDGTEKTFEDLFVEREG